MGIVGYYAECRPIRRKTIESGEKPDINFMMNVPEDLPKTIEAAWNQMTTSMPSHAYRSGYLPQMRHSFYGGVCWLLAHFDRNLPKKGEDLNENIAERLAMRKEIMDELEKTWIEK